MMTLSVITNALIKEIAIVSSSTMFMHGMKEITIQRDTSMDHCLDIKMVDEYGHTHNLHVFFTNDILNKEYSDDKTELLSIPGRQADSSDDE